MNSVTNPAAELRLRDRLLRPFFSRSRGRLPSPQSLTSPPSSTLPASSPTTLSNTLSNALSTDEIVDRAWKQLSDHERSILQPFRASCGSTSGALEHCLAATIQQRQVWEGKRWTITFGNRTITVKEEADKIVRWLDRFKAVGDVAVNADPVHAGLPWAGVRLLLEVAISDANQMAALLVGCETAMYMIHRLKAYVDFLSQLPATLTRSNFETVLIAMHAMILAFLACALEKYQQSTLRRTFTALWHASDVQDFERDCNQRGASLEIEASNCDRTLAEQDRRRLGQIYQDLHKVLTNIAQIHHMQETLERLERKLDLSRLKSVEGAPFDAYSQVHRGCHPATRVDLLRSIQDWAQQPGGKSIFWLNGGAGTGKSTISYTVAQQLANQGWGTNIALGASFFFKRGESDRGSAALLFPTIVRQLAKKIDGLDVLVAKAIDADTDIGNKALGEQFARLIRAPLQQLLPVRTHPVYVIVLDALDECAPRDISTVLQLWSTLPDFAKDHLRVFLTSRPDLPVLSGFDEISVNVRIDLDLLEMTRATIKNDIFIFLQTAFVEIRQKYNRRPLSRIFLHDDWPDDVMIQELAQMATPLFIVAATVCLFVGDRNWDPRERLKTVLDLRRTGQMSQMGQTYLPVLKQILMDVSDRSDEDKLYREFRVVVGAIVTVAEPLSEVALEELLHMPRGSVALRLQPLQSVLDIPKDPEAVIRPLHLSFGEYLTGQEVQNEPFGVDAAATHRMLWRHCLRILSGPHGLHENMCGLNYPGQRQSTVSSTQREMYLPPVVRYASRYWVHHVQASTYRLCDQDEIHVFLEKHFLHWLEALSFMDRLADAIASVTTLQSVVAVEDSTGVASFLQDARRFILANRYIGEQAPLQLYSSAVIFAPQASITRNVCGQVPAWIVQSPATPTTWSLELQKLEGHTNEVNAVAFSHDSSLLASASGDQTVRLWNPATGQEVQKLEGHTSTVYTIAFSHNNSLLASASSDQTVRLWNPATGQEVQKLEGHTEEVSAVAFSYDSSLLASASPDHTVRLWNPATGQEVQKLVHNDRVIAVAFSHDSSLLASASDDQTVRLWNPATGQEVQKLEGHNDWVRAVAFSHDSSLLASASDDKTVRLWNPATGQEVQKLEENTDWVRAVAFSHDSSLLASASDDKTVRLWNPATGQEVQKLEGHTEEVSAVAFSHDSSLLASASDDKTVRLWNPATGHKMQKLEGHIRRVNAIAFSHDSSLLASASDDQTVRLWNPATGQDVQKLVHNTKVKAVAFSHDSLLLASASINYIVQLWNLATGQEVQKLKGHNDWVRAVAFSHDSSLLASASDDKTVRLWNPAIGQEVQRLEGHTAWVKAVAFSHNSSLLASASDDKTVRLWNPATGQEVQKLEGHTRGVSAVAFSHNSSLLASASYDHTLRLWNPATGHEVQKFDNLDLILEIGFTAGNKALLTDKGLIKIDSSYSSNLDTGPNSCDALMLRDGWVEYEGKQILWLPQEYRSAVSAIRQNLIAFGLGTGPVAFLRIEYT